MTIKQIAAVCQVDVSTVKKWVKSGNGEIFTKIGEKITIAFNSKKPARFDLDETIAIIRAGGNRTLADLLLENARKTKLGQRSLRLPNGKQLEELRRIYGAAEARQLINYLVGFSKYEMLASPEFGRKAFARLKESLSQKQLDFGRLN